ncbi:hypothetical protein GCM10008170_10700 [Methylopila capsulata]|nr:hypothetical protein GCM10008170_10700 [Methylopila capsulata]
MAMSSRAHWKVEVVRDFDFHSDEYRRLFDRSAASGFQSPAWLDATYAAIRRAPLADPFILTVRDLGTSALVALAPLVLRHRFGLKVVAYADIGSLDYCCVVQSPEFEIGLDSALRRDIDAALKAADALFIPKVPDAALRSFDRLLSARRLKMDYSAHPVPLFAPFSEWRDATMNGTTRRSLDKKRRKLGRIGRLETVVGSEPAFVAATIDQIRVLREPRFAETGVADPLKSDAFRAFYGSLKDSGTVRAYQLRLDGATIACGFAMVHDDACHLLLTGFDVGNWRNYSVGLLMIEDAIADCVARGERVFDFTIGDHPYKADFGSQSAPIWRLTRALSFKGWLMLAAMQLKGGERLARRLAPRSYRAPSPPDMVRGAGAAP